MTKMNTLLPAMMMVAMLGFSFVSCASLSLLEDLWVAILLYSSPYSQCWIHSSFSTLCKSEEEKGWDISCADSPKVLRSGN